MVRGADMGDNVSFKNYYFEFCSKVILKFQTLRVNLCRLVHRERGSPALSHLLL